MKRLKVLVLGAAGMAGHAVAQYMLEKGHDVVGFARRKTGHVPMIVGDACDERLLRSVIHSRGFDAVINCIAVLNQHAEEDKPLAVYINSRLPHYLAHITRETTTQIIHMSTESVFSGLVGEYAEGSLRDASSFYGRTKALGELEDDKNLTLRNSVIGPDLRANGTGLLNWFMTQEGTISGYTKALWTGLTTIETARVMEYAATEKITGLVNMVYTESISKYELLRLFNKHLRGNAVRILPCESVAHNRTLLRTRFDLNYRVPDYETMIMAMADWIRAHKHMYPHYDA